ncbi:hypothetical protein FOZ62_018337, partial [Perkinsus olseni]
MMGNYNMTAVKAMKLFVNATLGISIASAELEDTKVHGNSAAHKEELDGLVNWAKSFYGLLQSSIEGCAKCLVVPYAWAKNLQLLDIDDPEK